MERLLLALPQLPPCLLPLPAFRVWCTSTRPYFPSKSSPSSTPHRWRHGGGKAAASTRWPPAARVSRRLRPSSSAPHAQEINPDTYARHYAPTTPSNAAPATPSASAALALAATAAAALLALA